MPLRHQRDFLFFMWSSMLNFSLRNLLCAYNLWLLCRYVISSALLRVHLQIWASLIITVIHLLLLIICYSTSCLITLCFRAIFIMLMFCLLFGHQKAFQVMIYLTTISWKWSAHRTALVDLRVLDVRPTADYALLLLMLTNLYLNNL